MDLAKSEAKRRSAFADFLKVKQLQSNDRYEPTPVYWHES